jgi:hypothetical protein
MEATVTEMENNYLIRKYDHCSVMMSLAAGGLGLSGSEIVKCNVI